MQEGRTEDLIPHPHERMTEVHRPILNFTLEVVTVAQVKMTAVGLRGSCSVRRTPQTFPTSL